MTKVFHQGTEYEPRFSSTRLIFLLMMVSSVVVFENYAASYTAFLAVVKLAVPFTSVRDMYRSTDYKIGAPVGTAYKQFLVGVSREAKSLVMLLTMYVAILLAF